MYPKAYKQNLQNLEDRFMSAQASLPKPTEGVREGLRQQGRRRAGRSSLVKKHASFASTDLFMHNGIAKASQQFQVHPIPLLELSLLRLLDSNFLVKFPMGLEISPLRNNA